MAASMLEAAMVSSLGMSGSEARDMLSGETVVGGVQLRDAALEDDTSVGVLEKLDSLSKAPRSAIAGAISTTAIAVAG
jgi:hypothetical protein